MKQRIVRSARYAASLAIGMTHLLLALWAGSAAGGWAWRHGYTLPFDTSSSAVMSAAIVFGLVAAGAVVNLPEPWMTQVCFLVRGRPLLACDTCGALVGAADHDDVNTTPKETTP
ncbi:hypothetical protein [Streptomyces sp. NPDC002530]